MLEAFVKHPDDPSWPLVARTVESHDGGEVGIGRRTGDGRRAGMGHLGDHGAERDHHRGVDRGATSVMASLKVRQSRWGSTPSTNTRSGLVGQRQDVDPVIGPVDDTTAVVSDADLGPALAEVEERVGVDDPTSIPPVPRRDSIAPVAAPPTSKRPSSGDKDRRTQGGQIGGPLEHGHQPSMPAHHDFGTVGR